MLDSSFIVENPEALSKENCEKIIDFFESSPQYQQRGQYAGNSGSISDSVKVSTDMYLNFHLDDAKKGEEKINLDLLGAVCDTSSIFKMRYPQTANLEQWQIRAGYNLQKYEPMQGYYKEHCENESYDCPRVLVWMVYLNDVDDGGTHFPYQNMTVKAEQGKCVVWPAYFTHMHYGQVSFTKTKYIATGWFVYSAGLTP
jgi:hypothetical protein